MKFSNWILVGALTATLGACGSNNESNNATANNTTANNTTANNTTANNTTANNTTANNTTANNTTANNTTMTTNTTNTTNTNSGNPLACDGDFGAADACGGSIIGTWDVSEGCTNYDYAAQIQGACANAVVQDAVVDVSGTLTIDAVTFARQVTGTISLEMSSADGCGIGSCAVVEAGLGAVGTATCTDDGSGGCDCSVSVPIDSANSGTYVTAGGVATIGSGETYYYCASGGTLLLREFGTANDEVQPTSLYTAQ